MLSLRLTQKLEGLRDEALAHLEAQADLLLAMPAQCRDTRPLLHIVPAAHPHPRPEPAHAPRVLVSAAVAATTAAVMAADTERQHQLRADTEQRIDQARRLLAALRANEAAAVPRRRRLTAVRKQG